MRYLILVLAAYLTLLPGATAGTFEARVTVYWRHGSGTDSWTQQGQSASGLELRKGVCAVDPKVIPYGSQVKVCGMTLVAVDTGSDVVKRTASKKLGSNAPVVDVYFDHKREAEQFAATHPHFMLVTVN